MLIKDRGAEVFKKQSAKIRAICGGMIMDLPFI
jgi:hypothetical protein